MENQPRPAQPVLPPEKPGGVFIKLRGLPLNVKLLTIGGYLAVFVLLFCLLALEITKDVDFVQYTINGVKRELSLAALAFSSFAFIVGWAYLITGAAAAKGRVFLPVLGLLALQLFLLATNADLLPLFLEALFYFFVLVIYALTARTRFWRDYPLLHFVPWLAAIFIFFFLSAGRANSDAETARSMSANFAVLLLLSLAFWAILGLDIVNLGLGIGKWFTMLARKLLPFPVMTAITAFILLTHPAVTAVIFWLTQDGFWLLDYLFSLPLLILAFVLGITKRWSAQSSAVLMTLSLASPVIIFGLSLAFAGYDITEWLLELTGIFPPLLLFVGLTVYNLMNVGVSFTSVDGRILPRTARVLLYFGTLILVITFMLFMLNERDALTKEPVDDIQAFLNNLLAMGALGLGLPYLAWLAWKKRETLTGAEADFTAPPRWRWLERFPPRLWLPLSLVAACLGCCLLAGILYWLISLRGV